MKTHLSKKTLWQLILSVITLVIFIFLAVASSVAFFGLTYQKQNHISYLMGVGKKLFITASQKRITTGNHVLKRAIGLGKSLLNGPEENMDILKNAPCLMEGDLD